MKARSRLLPLVLLAALPVAAAQNPPPIHTFSGLGGDGFGSAVATGAIDTDGLSDLVVGAQYADPGGLSYAGSVSVYASSTQALLWSRDGTAASALFGHAVAVAEDLNGDGRGEVVVGSPRESNAGGTEAGRVQVLSGLDGSLLFEATGSFDYDSLGSSVAGLADFDGDGIGDFAAGAPTQGAGALGQSRVLIFSGANGSALATLYGNDPGWGAFGTCLARAGDVDGDGIDDLIVGEPLYDGVLSNAGRVAIHSGVGGALVRSLEGTVAQGRLGSSVAGIGDADGDGRADLIAGATPYSTPGYARIFSGATGATLRHLAGGVHFGASVAGAGDFDGDATLDVIVGTVDVFNPDPGTAQVFSGACGRLLAQYAGSGPFDQVGLSVAGMGDADGDGRADVVVSAPGVSEAVLERGFTRAPVSSYCTAGLSASGCLALLTGTGSPSASAPSGFDLVTSSVEGAQSGIFYYGANGRQARPWAKELRSEYGNISGASIGAIQRKLLILEEQGAEHFFSEPAVQLSDLMQTDFSGNGVISIMDVSTLVSESPRVYATFLLWLLSELFEQLPEVGDPEKPKMVFFFDEAHILFDQAPKPLIQKIEHVVRLIRSKGVGIYFITQSPLDIPEEVLGQLGLKIQHALRAFTPNDRKVIKSVARSFRTNEKIDAETVLTDLGIGEALVSTLDAKGRPRPVQRTLIRPPESRIGPLTDDERKERLNRSPLKGRYDGVVDRESAYEMLKKRAEELQVQQDEKTQQQAAEKAKPAKGRKRQSIGEAFMKSAARSIGSSFGRQIIRGVLGSIFGGKR